MGPPPCPCARLLQAEHGCTGPPPLQRRRIPFRAVLAAGYLSLIEVVMKPHVFDHHIKWGHAGRGYPRLPSLSGLVGGVLLAARPLPLDCDRSSRVTRDNVRLQDGLF
jgi:hypothetical protein